MLKRLFMLCLWLLVMDAGVRARAGTLLDYRRALTSQAHYSLSGQFIIHDVPPSADNFGPRLDSTDTNLVHLEPGLLAVSCERVKKALLRQLNARDQWQGKIFISLHRAQWPDEPVTIIPEHGEHYWVYELKMPDCVQRQRLVSALVEVLMLEMADRNADRSAEIPAWLGEGMSREVIFSSDKDLVIEEPRKMENGIGLNRLARTNLVDNPLIQAHEQLQTLAPLTLDQLSWPQAGQFEGPAGEAYRSSAQLFVHELLQLNDGRDCFRMFLPELAQHLNWQIAFQRAFHSHFATQRELEKWWALRVVQFTGRNIAQTWGAEDSWQKLDEVIRPFVEVRTGTNDLPLHTQITLQQIVRDWEIPRQKVVLQEKSQQLLLLRLRVSQELVYLVDDYRRTLDGYLKKRDHPGLFSLRKSLFAPHFDNLARETIHSLDILEARRQELRPNPQSAPVITANGVANH